MHLKFIAFIRVVEFFITITMLLFFLQDRVLFSLSYNRFSNELGVLSRWRFAELHLSHAFLEIEGLANSETLFAAGVRHDVRSTFLDGLLPLFLG